MKLLSAIARELLGLFLDDEFLAVAILAVIALSALLHWLAVAPLLTGAALLLGCVAVLTASLARAVRPAKPLRRTAPAVPPESANG